MLLNRPYSTNIGLTAVRWDPVSRCGLVRFLHSVPIDGEFSECVRILVCPPCRRVQCQQEKEDYASRSHDFCSDLTNHFSDHLVAHVLRLSLVLSKLSVSNSVFHHYSSTMPKKPPNIKTKSAKSIKKEATTPIHRLKSSTSLAHTTTADITKFQASQELDHSKILPSTLENLALYLDWRQPHLDAKAINVELWTVAAAIWDYLPVEPLPFVSCLATYSTAAVSRMSPFQPKKKSSFFTSKKA